MGTISFQIRDETSVVKSGGPVYIVFILRGSFCKISLRS